MTKYIHLTKKSEMRPVSRRAVRLNTRSRLFKFGASAMLLTSVVGYVMQVNSIATKGYHIKELEGSITDLRREHDSLQAEATRLQSMAAVKDRVGSLEMVTARDAEYLAPTPVAVAR